MAMGTKDALETKRDGYEDELAWHRFLLDSYTGGGGYQGRVKQDSAGFWGIAAATYGAFATLRSDGAQAGSTYLDQFPREDDPKFRRRRDVAHYLNYVEPTTAIKVGYICRKPHKRNNVPPELEKWIEETGYDKEFRRRALVTAVLGWFPMLVDLPRAPVDARTALQAGKLDPYTVLSLPCHLRDYELDESGRFVWAKMATCVRRKETWDAEPVEITRYTIWTATDYTVYECRDEAISEQPVTGRHPFGQVPIVSWRADTSIDDAVKASSVNASIATEGRRLFNLVSELDEHIRSQVFALLIWPGSAPAGGNNASEAGAENGLVIGQEQKNVPFFLAPPAAVAATLETRVKNTVMEIYRISGVEYEKASGTQSSAQSKEREFEKTNVSIASLAAAIARADRETLILVGRAKSVDEGRLQQIECQAHESYADEALGDELEQAMNAVSMQVGRQARVEILKRLVQKVLPGMSADTKRVVESEIEGEVDQAAKDAEAMKVVKLEGGEGGDEPPPGDEEEEDDEGEERAAAE